jgi:hypothetical protein
LALLAGFNLSELPNEFPCPAVQIIRNGLPLRIEPEAASTLAVGARTVISDKLAAVLRIHVGHPST